MKKISFVNTIHRPPISNEYDFHFSYYIEYGSSIFKRFSHFKKLENPLKHFDSITYQVFLLKFLKLKYQNLLNILVEVTLIGHILR